ncbi:Cof-type HAD-IIB family hydrolase [Halothermothrix orenii]|uniref:Cof-like hydrolase n=1 Tax=Halothermothrix orenii (strain H 168 / OCM 544 / DSM 9562) TaxID=373903 RepID=B8CYJ2_HALOH|nr:Cof-type HAD-IIB family hydrolase [Halothermothrix orenii]ACL70361.1 Cof-like hydrolase [Halothermothrix orenii H 168]
MKEYRMVAMDLDGTLIDENQNLSQVTIDVITELMNRGVICVIATGRMFISALPYVRKLGIKKPVITYNGAFIKDPVTNKVLHHKPIPLNLAGQVIKITEEYGNHINLYEDDRLLVARRNEETLLYEDIAGVKAREVGPLSDYLGKPPTKLLIIERDRDKYEAIYREIRLQLEDDLAVTRSRDIFIEIMGKEISKGKALEKVASGFEIPLSQVIAIGDSWNDLEMIKAAGLGVAMGNSPEQIKAEADLVTLSNKENGVARILEKVLLH